MLQINLGVLGDREVVCLFRVMFFPDRRFQRSTRTASSVPAFHRRHNKVQNDVSYWSEWALMGLPESTDKTHREKEKKNT